MPLIKLNKDIYPYCKGDVVSLTAKELKRVDAVAERRNLSNAYTSVQGGNANDTNEGDEGDGLDNLNLNELKEVATNEGVVIDGLRSKDEVRTAIRAKRTPETE